MLPEVLLQITALAVLATLILVGAVWVVLLRNLFRAALSLGLVLVGVAGMFLLLEADFLAFVQILIYVGAILTLVVFAIMLTAKLHAASAAPTGRQPIPAAVASLGLFVALISVTHTMVWPLASAGEAVTLSHLGQQLVTTLILPFEVISLVFVAAVVGAIAVAAAPRSERPSKG